MMVILSLFDGLFGAQIAVNRLGIKDYVYYSSEIDKYGVAVTQYNYPNTIQLGDINNWKNWKLPKIDLLIGGSPCQGFSLAGKKLNFDDSRSKLFFKFVDILNFYKPKYFLLENVKMKKQWENIITDYLKVFPIEINSSLVSAQSRKRLYWTNIKGKNQNLFRNEIEQPEDKRIYLKDILENGFTDNKKSFCITANYYKGINLKDYFDKKRNQIVFNKPIQVGKDFSIKGWDVLKRIYSINGKAPNLTSQCGGNQDKKIIIDKESYRKLTPLECERLQTLSDNYTKYGLFENEVKEISNTYKYKMIGNGFTIDVICHILKNIKEEFINDN